MPQLANNLFLKQGIHANFDLVPEQKIHASELPFREIAEYTDFSDLKN